MASLDPKETVAYIVKTLYSILEETPSCTEWKILVHIKLAGIPSSPISRACRLFMDVGLITYEEEYSSIKKRDVVLTPEMEERLVTSLLEQTHHSFLIPCEVVYQVRNEIFNCLSDTNGIPLDGIMSAYSDKIKKDVLEWLVANNYLSYKEDKYFMNKWDY